MCAAHQINRVQCQPSLASLRHKMCAYLRRGRYGNRDISGDVDATEVGVANVTDRTCPGAC